MTNLFDEFINVGIIGSRSRNSQDDYIKVHDAFIKLKNEFVSDEREFMIVSGGAKSGGDAFAKMLHEQYQTHYTEYVPQYLKHKNNPKYAPLSRNHYTAKHSEILIACVNNNKKGGTEDTIDKFKAYHPTGRLILV